MAKLQIFSLVTLACLVIACLPAHRILAWSSFLSVFFFFLLFIYLDSTFFLIRAVFYLSGWVIYRYVWRRLSIAQDNSKDNKNHVKNFKLSAVFLVFFLVTESMMSWDWIMSIDPHWFSTLFGWYVFARMVVSVNYRLKNTPWRNLCKPFWIA